MSYIRTEIFYRLLDMGISKYRIAKEVNRSYQTVFAWARGWWKPDVESMIRLERYYHIECANRGIEEFAVDLFEKNVKVPVLLCR